MTPENQRDEDLKKADSIIQIEWAGECERTGATTFSNHSLTFLRGCIANALSALRASWEKEKEALNAQGAYFANQKMNLEAEKKELQDLLDNRLENMKQMQTAITKDHAKWQEEKKGLGEANAGLEGLVHTLEERVRELEGAFRSANYSAQTFENECTRLKAKVAELTAELQATRKACDQAHQNTLDREEERDRLKAENERLREVEFRMKGLEK